MGKSFLGVKGEIHKNRSLTQHTFFDIFRLQLPTTVPLNKRWTQILELSFCGTVNGVWVNPVSVSFRLFVPVRSPWDYKSKRFDINQEYTLTLTLLWNWTPGRSSEVDLLNESVNQLSPILPYLLQYGLSWLYLGQVSSSQFVSLPSSVNS